MSGNRFTLPFVEVQTASGGVAAGWKLDFFQSGGFTTPQDTYSDKDLTVANTNPVVADGAGRFPNIFLQQLDYAVRLLDVNDNVVWTADPVSPILQVEVVGTPSVANLAALTALTKVSLTDGIVYQVDSRTTAGDLGGGRFTWDASSTLTADGATILAADEGGTGRWVRVINRLVLATWFGVDPTGTADNLSALQAFLDASAGRDAYIPAGTYNLSNALFVSSGTNLQLHPDAILKVANLATFGTDERGLLQLRNVTDVRISGGELDGSYDTNNAGRISGILIEDGSQYIRVDGMYIHDFPGSEPAGVLSGDGVLVAARNSGPQAQVPCDDIWLVNLRIQGCARQGISLVRALNVVITGCHISDIRGTSLGAGIDVEGGLTDSGKLDRIIIADTIITACHRGIVTSYNCDRVSIANVVLSSNRLNHILCNENCARVRFNSILCQGGMTADGAIPIHLQTGSDIVIDGVSVFCTTLSTERDGIRVTSATDVEIRNAIVDRAAEAGIRIGHSTAGAAADATDVTLQDCKLVRCGGPSFGMIEITPNSDSSAEPRRVGIKGCRFIDDRTAPNQARYGIGLDGAISASALADHRYRDNDFLGLAIGVEQGADPMVANQSHNFASLGASEAAFVDITLSGLAIGDKVEAWSQATLGGAILFADAHSDNTARVTILNPTGVAIDLPEQTFFVRRIPAQEA